MASLKKTGLVSLFDDDDSDNESRDVGQEGEVDAPKTGGLQSIFDDDEPVPAIDLTTKKETTQAEAPETVPEPEPFTPRRPVPTGTKAEDDVPLTTTPEDDSPIAKARRRYRGDSIQNYSDERRAEIAQRQGIPIRDVLPPDGSLERMGFINQQKVEDYARGTYITYKSAEVGLDSGRISWKDRMGTMTPEESAQRDAIEKQQADWEEEAKKAPFIGKAVSTIAPSVKNAMIKHGQGAVWGGMAGAGLFALAGNLIPGMAALPEEPITAMAGFKAGATVFGMFSSTADMGQIEGGQVFRELTKLGMDRDKAGKVADIVNTGVASSEVIGLGAFAKLIPGKQKLINSIIVNAIKNNVQKSMIKTGTARVLKPATLETGVELLQQLQQNIATTIAKEVNTELDKTDLSAKDKTEIWDRLKKGLVETGLISFVGMGVLAVPAAAVSVGQHRNIQSGHDAMYVDSKSATNPAPGVTIIPASEDVQDVNNVAPGNRPSVVRLLDAETEVEDGISVSHRPGMTDAQAEGQLHTNDAVKSVITDLATKRQMSRFNTQIDSGEARLDELRNFYYQAVEEEDHPGALQIANMMDDQVNTLTDKYIELVETSAIEADNRGRALNPDHISEIQRHVAEIGDHAKKQVQAQTKAVNNIRINEQQKYIDSLGTTEGLQSELINQSVVNTNNNKPAVAKLYDNVVQEMKLRESTGTMKYFSMTPMSKLVKLQIQAQKRAIEDRSNNAGANTLARNDAIDVWMKQQIADRTGYDDVSLLEERMILDDKVAKDKAAAAVQRQAAIPVVKAVEQRRVEERAKTTQKKQKEAAAVAEKVEKGKRQISDLRSQLKKPIPGPTRTEELAEAKADKAKRDAALARQRKENADLLDDVVEQDLTKEKIDSMSFEDRAKHVLGKGASKEDVAKMAKAAEKAVKDINKKKPATVKHLQKKDTSFTILSSDNPGTKDVQTATEKVRARSALKKKLDSMGVKYTMGTSKFEGLDEVPFVIEGLTEAQSKELSDSLGQSSFIYAQPGDKVDIIEGTDRYSAKRSSLKLAPDATDNYTEIGGEKFTIDFDFGGELDTEAMQMSDTVATKAQTLFRAAAIQLADGTVAEGTSHMTIVDKVVGIDKILAMSTEDANKIKDGFVTHAGKFVERDEATKMVGKTDPTAFVDDINLPEPLYSEDFLGPVFEQRIPKNFEVGDFRKMTLEGQMGTLEAMDSLEKEMKLGKYKFVFDKTKAAGIKTIFITAPGQYGKLNEVKSQFNNLKAREDAVQRFDGVMKPDPKTGKMRSAGGSKGMYLKNQNAAIINLPAIGRVASNLNQALETLVHEHVHGLTAMAEKNMSKEELNRFGRELRSVWESIPRDLLNSLRDDPMTHPRVRMGIVQVDQHLPELVSYSMSHPEFASWLNTIPASSRFKAMSSKIQSVWDALVNLIVKRQLKMPSKLDEVTDILNRHMKFTDAKGQQSKGSGRWATPLRVYQDYVNKNPKATVEDIVDNTTLSAYQANTIMEMLAQNAGAVAQAQLISPKKLTQRVVDATKVAVSGVLDKPAKPETRVESLRRKGHIPPLSLLDKVKEKVRFQLSTADRRANLVKQEKQLVAKLGLPKLSEQQRKTFDMLLRTVRDAIKTEDYIYNARYRKGEDIDITSFDFGANVEETAVKEWTDELDNIAENSLPTTVVADKKGMEDALGFAVAGEPTAVWTTDGDLIIRADMVDSKESLVRTWMHEQVAHQGLRNIFGDNKAAFNRFLDRSFSLFAIKEPELVFQMARLHDIFVWTNTSGNDIVKFKQNDRRLISEEIIARKAESLKPVTKRGIIKRFQDFMKRWLPGKFVGLVDTFALTDADVMNMLMAARENVFTGTNKFGTLLDKALADRRPSVTSESRSELKFMETDKTYLDWAESVNKQAPNLRKWYSEHTEIIGESFGKDSDIFSVLLAVTSPQADVETNVQFAADTYAYMLGLRDKPGALFPNKLKDRIDNNWTSPEAMLKDLESTNFKVTEFGRALLGDPSATVGDMWMYRAFFGDPLSVGKTVETFNVGQITQLREKLHSLAAQMTERTGTTWTPREIQAAIWVHINAAQTGKTISQIASYKSGLNKPSPKYGGKTPLEHLQTLVPNLNEGPLSDVVGMENIPLAPISPLQKKLIQQVKKTVEGKHPVSTKGVIRVLKPGVDNDSVVRMINAIVEGGRSLTAASEEMATWYKETFGFERVDSGLEMRLSKQAVSLFSDNKGVVKFNIIRDNLSGFSGAYTRVVRFSRDAKANLDQIANISTVDQDAEFLKTNDDNVSTVGKIHEWRDQSELNINRFIDQLEQEFLEKFGGRKARLARVIRLQSGKLLNTIDTELLQKAMNLYIDSGVGTNRAKAEAFALKLANKHKAGTITAGESQKLDIVERMLTLSEEEATWADSNIRPYYEDFFQFAQEHDILDSHVDNYVKRIWNMPRKLKDAMVTWNGAGTTGFKLTPSSGKQRSFESIIDGWEAGMDLRTEGVLTNLQTYSNEIGYTFANRRFVEYMDSLINETGDGLVVEVEDGFNPPDGYVQLTDRGFARPGFKAFARRDLATAVNKIGDRATHKFWEIPIIKGVRIMNAIIKSTILSVSMFHHLAGMRSYVFGVEKGVRINPVKAYRKGLAKIDKQEGFTDPNYKHLGPIVDFLVREGLTLGKTQDWDEAALQDSLLEEFLARRKGGTAQMALKGWQGGRRWRRQMTQGLFGRLFAGLKAESAASELTYAMRKMEKELGRGLTEAEMKTEAQKVARLINADFGGLHLKRMGRNPDLQRLAQMFFLAPDWTESNWRTVSGMIPGLNNQINKLIGDNPAPAGMEKVYRKFWRGIALRGVAGVALANVAVLTLFGDDDDWKDWREMIDEQLSWKNWHKGRWLSVNMDPVYRKLGMEDPDKRALLSVVGHFKDILKIGDYKSLIKHKISPAGRIVETIYTGTDWKGARFTTLTEMLQDGRFTAENSFVKDPEGLEAMSTMVALTGYNLRQSLPIFGSEALQALQGESNALSSLLRAGGMDIRDTRRESVAQQKYDTVNSEINKLDKNLKDAQTVGDRRMIVEARKDIKRYDGFNKKKSRIGFAKTQLRPINSEINKLKLIAETRNLTAREEKDLSEQKEKRDRVYQKFVKVIER